MAASQPLVKQGHIGPHSLILRVFLILTIIKDDVAAIISCQPDGPGSDPSLGDALCVDKYRAGSRCIRSDDTYSPPTVGNAAATGGMCSNPFISGCLRNYLGEENFGRKRVCNSDDDDGAAERGECVESQFDYGEIRILSQV